MPDKDINRFIIRVFIFASLLFAIIAIGLVIPIRSTIQSFHYCVVDKQNMLRQVGSPRIVLLGGSSVCLGFDSKKIQDSLNINVVNAGTYAGYGLRFIIDVMAPYIKEGDIVILSPEYELFFAKGNMHDSPAVIAAIEVAPDSLYLLSPGQALSQIKYIPQHSFKRLAASIKAIIRPRAPSKEAGVYERLAFNRFGDVDAHWNKPGMAIQSETVANNDNVNPVAFRILDNIRNAVEAKNGHFYIAYPCLNQGSYRLSESKIRLIEQGLTENHFITLGDPERYSLPDDMYYDTRYHLNKKGVDTRTGFLIQDLKKHGL